MVAEIPAREIEQTFLEIDAGAGQHRGGEAGQKQQQNPAPRPQVEDGAAERGAANPARITESIEKRYPRAGWRMISRGESVPDCPPGEVPQFITKCSPS